MAARSDDRVIDAHLHIWQLSRFEYRWLDEESPLYRDYLMSDLREATSGVKLVGGILVEAANTPAEIAWLLEIADGEAGCWGVIGWIDLDSIDAPTQIDQFALYPRFKGVRLNWLAPRPEPEQLHQAMSALERNRLVVDVLAGYDHLAEVAAFMRHYPQITFVLEHFGGAALRNENLHGWIAAMQPFAALPNVILKVSGFTTATSQPPSVSCLSAYLHAADQIFTAERLMFGSNYPVCLYGMSYAGTLARLQQAAADMTADAQASLFYETTLRTYHLH